MQRRRHKLKNPVPPPGKIWIYWCLEHGDLLDQTTCTHEAEEWRKLDNCNVVVEYRPSKKAGRK